LAGATESIPVTEDILKKLARVQPFPRCTPDCTIIKIKSVYIDNVNTLGLTDYKRDNYSITISTPERAMLELIYLFPKYAVVEDMDIAMEGMTTLRPGLVQQLLESCQSVKVKRYYMWLAEHHQHDWVKKLDTSRVNFGRGKRLFIKGGRFDNKYQITVPLDKNQGT
jgi:hypothetical protein